MAVLINQLIIKNFQNPKRKIVDDPVKSKKYYDQHILIFKAIVKKNPNKQEN